MRGEWYAMDYEAWDEGTDGLSLELEAAYLRLCHQMYRRHGPVPDSLPTLARIWRCHVNKARVLRQQLIDAGKIKATSRGLSNARVVAELTKRGIKPPADPGHIPPHTPDIPPRGLGGDIPHKPLKSHDPPPGDKSREEKIAAAADARAREPLFANDLWTLVSQLAVICGHDPDPKNWPPQWCGAPMRVQSWLNDGWLVPIILAGAQIGAARKPAGTIQRVEYLEGAIADEHARQAKPLPKGHAGNVVTINPESGHGEHRSTRSFGGAANAGRGRSLSALAVARAKGQPFG